MSTPDLGSGCQDFVLRASFNEWLIKKNKEINYFIFGHRHFPIEHELDKDCTYINLGDWINHFTYAVYNGKTTELKKFN